MAKVSVGEVHEKVVIEDLTRTQIVMYSGASGDYNPVHSDNVYATEVAGYKGVFGHGMLTMGATGTAVTDLVGAENVRSFGGRFRSQVWPGDTLTATVTVDAITDKDGQNLAEMSVVTVNQDGEEVFSGKASAIVD
jgi:acyl dehydratase